MSCNALERTPSSFGVVASADMLLSPSHSNNNNVHVVTQERIDAQPIKGSILFKSLFLLSDWGQGNH